MFVSCILRVFVMCLNYVSAAREKVVKTYKGGSISYNMRWFQCFKRQIQIECKKDIQLNLGRSNENTFILHAVLKCVSSAMKCIKTILKCNRTL